MAFLVIVLIFFVVIASLTIINKLNEIKSLIEAMKKEFATLKAAQSPQPTKPSTIKTKVITPHATITSKTQVEQENTQQNDQTPHATDDVIQPKIRTQPTLSTPDIKPTAQTTASAPKPPPIKQPKQTRPTQPSWLEKGIRAAWSWLTGGNSVARVGVLVLFFGVSFLLKYAADNDMLPAELRLGAAAIGGIVLLILGWRLKDKNKDYGLLLQGAGIGMLYLTAFTTYYLYHFISVGVAFSLLVLVSALATALAIRQNAAVLAIAGFIGGYLTPIMVSTGTNNYIALFSYYALLNTAVATIAWFQSWRLLNLIAFAFTFIVSTAWGVLSYQPENFSTTQPFLIIFFLQFLSIAILFALRQPPNLKGYIDGTLIFGTPIIAFGLQLKLVEAFEYGAAISALIVGSIYMGLAFIIYQRRQESLRLLAEAFLAIGIIFLSLAIPFAVDPDITAAVWALEGAGLYWVGVRQKRLLLRVFALLLQVGAAMAFSQHATISHETDTIMAFLNSSFIGSAMIAIGAWIIAWFSQQDFTGRHKQEAEISSLLFSWGMLWWLVAGFVQINAYFNLLQRPNILLTFLTITAIIMVFITRKLDWNYSRYVSWAFIPSLAVSAFAVVNAASHPAYEWGGLAWLAAFAVAVWILWEADQEQQHQAEITTEKTTTSALPQSEINHLITQHRKGIVVNLLHNITLLGFVIIATWEGSWQLTQHVAFYSGWHMAWLPIMSMVLLWVMMRAPIWPFTQHKDSYHHIAGMMLALALIAWNLFSFQSTGNSAPLPWIPIFNSIDIIHILSIITLFIGWHHYQPMVGTTLDKQDWHRYVLAGLITLAFLWLNVTIMRTVHHWTALPYDLSTLLNSPIVQTAFSILWTISSVSMMLLAGKKQWRKLWLGGATLMAIVVVKLFIIDLANSGTVERIISFIIVGILMVAIGYFAPIPQEQEQKKKQQGVPQP